MQCWMDGWMPLSPYLALGDGALGGGLGSSLDRRGGGALDGGGLGGGALGRGALDGGGLDAGALGRGGLGHLRAGLGRDAQLLACPALGVRHAARGEPVVHLGLQGGREGGRVCDWGPAWRWRWDRREGRQAGSSSCLCMQGPDTIVHE